MLGLVLHSAIAYMQTPMGELWGYKDSQSHFGFDLVVAFLHTFRMPVFFMLSGFFACMLYEDRGVSEMVRNRRRRVLYPLVVGWLFLFPLTIAGFGFGQLGGTREGAKEAIEYVVTGKAVEHLQLLHLWFLFDLVGPTPIGSPAFDRWVVLVELSVLSFDGVEAALKALVFQVV